MLVPLHPKTNNNNLKDTAMEKLTKREMEAILGGGYWYYLSDGTKIYIPDGDEEGVDDDIIFS